MQPTAASILAEIRPLGRESYKRVMLKHGAREPLYGVAIAELKKIQKRVKRDHELALALYDTGVYDAMYLAGLVADDQRMRKKDLERWVKGAYCSALAEYTVAWVAAEGPHGLGLARTWIDSKHELVASAGWATWSGLVALRKDAELDLHEVRALLERIESSIHGERNHVRYAMNGFVIAVGAYVKSLNPAARKVALKIGIVCVDLGDTACKVPSALTSIAKVEQRGALGKKRKTVKC
jgi:3-methyladenine DNA glycosylase AlkD